MQKETRQEFYESPGMEVMEMNSMQVMCQSQGTAGITDMNNEEGEW